MGWCGADSDPSAPEFPYVSNRISIPSGENWTGVASLGPTDQGLAREVWGVNTSGKTVVATTPYQDQVGGLNTANPELMSYCRGLGIEWASDTTYTALRKRIDARFDLANEPTLAGNLPESMGEAASVQSPDQQVMSNQEKEYLLVRGRINLENDSLGFRSFSKVKTTPDRADAIAPSSGDYTLQALDGSDSVVEEVHFEPSVGVRRQFRTLEPSQFRFRRTRPSRKSGYLVEGREIAYPASQAPRPRQTVTFWGRRPPVPIRQP